MDQIWIKFSFCPKVEIEGCYIAPRDSPYYSHESISFVQEMILSNKNLEYVLIGDANCRFGNLLDELNLPFGWQRNQSEDNKPQPNMNSRNFFHVLRDCDLIPLNNLSSSRNSFGGALTFRKKQLWISELDWCICTHNVLSCISKISFIKDISLPSNHAPICIELNLPVSLEFVMDRAEDLLGHACEISQTCLRTNICKKPRKVFSDYKDRVINYLDIHLPPPRVSDIDQYAFQFSEALYFSLNLSDKSTRPSVSTELDRWTRLLNSNDHKSIWKAIIWKGKIEFSSDKSHSRPDDSEFKLHFEPLLNPLDLAPLNPELTQSHVTVPVLDDPISVKEKTDTIKLLKPNKTSGPDGVSPGVFKYLPESWVNSLTYLLNQVFEGGTFPNCWTFSKLSVLYRKENPALCNDYMGISVMNSIAKVYDMIIGKRLDMWFTPLREQAGAQK